MNITFNPRDRHCMYRGRNGFGICSGVNITPPAGRSASWITIKPINTKGISDACFIEIPQDREVLLSIIAALVEVADGTI